MDLDDPAHAPALLDDVATPLTDTGADDSTTTSRERQVGRYRLLERVGAGGMGVVWGAWDPKLERRVAIKFVHATLVSARDRILAEGQALAKLSHPHVIPIYDVGVVGQDVYLVMEWVRGKNLRAWCREPRDVREIVQVFRTAGAGLAAAHAAGLIHRDFKPDNAMVGDDGRVRVLDFGLARTQMAVGSQDRSTHDTRGAGTPGYMPPEQRAGKPLTVAVDQYAFGVALREALERREANGSNAPVPAWIARIIARATAPSAAQRFGSMDDLLAALARDPRVVWRRRLVGGALLGLAATSVALGLRSAPAVETCPGQDLGAAWSAGDGARLAARARALGPYGAVVAQRLADLDAYATRWSATHRQACRAHAAGELPARLYEQSLACLSRARASLGAVQELLSTTSSEHLPDVMLAVRGLPAVDACRDASDSSITPPSAALAPIVRGFEDQIARARVLALAGEPRAVAITSDLRTATAALGYVPLAAHAALAHGTALLSQQERADAIEALHAAALAAFEVGDSLTAVEAIARGVYAVAMEARSLPEHASALTGAIDVAMSVARGLGPRGGFVRALLSNNVGVLHLSRNERSAGRSAFDRAERERPAITGETYELATITGNVAMLESDPALRARLFAREAEELARVIGAEHPLAIEERVRAAMYATDPTDARGQLHEACDAYQRLHPHLGERRSQCAYELAWLALVAQDEAETRAALAMIAPGGMEGRFARGLGELLEGRPEAAATLLVQLADDLGARSATWAHWRAVDALAVAARAELAAHHEARAKALIDRARATASGLSSLSGAPFFGWRIAELERLRGSL